MLETIEINAMTVLHLELEFQSECKLSKAYVLMTLPSPPFPPLPEGFLPLSDFPIVLDQVCRIVNGLRCVVTLLRRGGLRQFFETKLAEYSVADWAVRDALLVT